MPEQYLKIRDRLIAQGRSAASAKRTAAATYNKRHPGAPVTAAYDANHHVRKELRKKVHGR